MSESGIYGTVVPKEETSVCTLRQEQGMKKGLSAKKYPSLQRPSEVTPGFFSWYFQ